MSRNLAPSLFAALSFLALVTPATASTTYFHSGATCEAEWGATLGYFDTRAANIYSASSITAICPISSYYQPANPMVRLWRSTGASDPSCLVGIETSGGTTYYGAAVATTTVGATWVSLPAPAFAPAASYGASFFLCTLPNSTAVSQTYYTGI